MNNIGNDDVLFSIMTYMTLKTLIKFSMTAKRHASIYENQLDLIKILDLSEFIFDKLDTLEKLKSFLVNKAFKNLQTIVPDHMRNSLLFDESFAEKFYALHPRFVIPSGQQLNRKFLQQFPDLTITSAELNEDFIPALSKPDNAVTQLRVVDIVNATKIINHLHSTQINFDRVRVLKVEKWLFCTTLEYWETFFKIIQKCPILEILVVGSIVAADAHPYFRRFDRFCQQSHKFKILVNWVQTDNNISIFHHDMPHAAKFVQRFRDRTRWLTMPSPFLSEMTAMIDFSAVHSVPSNWSQLSPTLQEIHAPLNSFLLDLLRSGQFLKLERLSINCRECNRGLMNELANVLARTNQYAIRHLMLFSWDGVAEDVRKLIAAILLNLCSLLETFYLDIDLKPIEILQLVESAPRLKSLRIFVPKDDLMNNALFRSSLREKIRRHPKLYAVKMVSDDFECTVVGSDL